MSPASEWSYNVRLTADIEKKERDCMKHVDDKVEQQMITTEEYLRKKKIIGRNEEGNSHQRGDYLSEASLFSSFFFNNL